MAVPNSHNTTSLTLPPCPPTLPHQAWQQQHNTRAGHAGAQRPSLATELATVAGDSVGDRR